MSAMADLVQRALAQRFAGGGAGPGVAPLTPGERVELRALQTFLARFACNSQVRAASIEDRARLEEFYTAVGGANRSTGLIIVDRDAHLADHAQSFIRATTKPSEPEGLRFYRRMTGERR
jgi:hypothetical protein